MSDYNKLTKADLVSVLKKLSVHVVQKDTKKVLIEKLDGYVSSHPGEGSSTVQAILDELDADEGDEDDTTLAGKDDDDVIEVEQALPKVTKAEAILAGEGEDDDEEEDPDFQAPPINLKSWVVDPVLEHTEAWLDKVYEFTDSVGITYLEYSDVLREQLSTSVSLNFLQLAAEASYFLYTHVPVVALKNNTLNHQVFKDNSAFLASSTLPTPQITALLDSGAVSTFVLWVLTAIVLPLLASYYFNFSRRVLVFDGAEGIVGRIYSYDPFIFAITKVLVFYFIAANTSALTSLHSLEGLWYAFQNYFLIRFGVYGHFLQSLGTFPIVTGVANVAIALYSQFEDY